MIKPFIAATVAAAFVALSTTSIAQTVSLKMRGNNVPAFVVQGELFASVVAKDKTALRTYMQHDAANKVLLLTEVALEADGTVNAINVYTLPLAKLKDEGGSGSSASENPNDSYARPVGTLTLLCTGINQPCMNRDEVDTATGKSESKSPETYLTVLFEKTVDAEVFLQRVLKLR